MASASAVGTKPNSRRELRDAAARMFAEGYPIGLIAERAGYTAATLRRWLEDPIFQQLVHDKRETILAKAAIGATKILLCFENLVDDAIGIARDPGHKDQGQMLRYLVDKVMVPTTRQETRAHHTVDVTVWDQLDQRMAKFERMAAKATSPPKLLEGAEAIRSYGQQVAVEDVTQLSEAAQSPLATPVGLESELGADDLSASALTGPNTAPDSDLF